MIGNNSAGARSIWYGMTVDHVIALDVVLADGTRTTFEPLSAQAWQQRSQGQSLEAGVYREVTRAVEQNRDEIVARFPRIVRRASGYNLDAFVDGFSDLKPES